MSDYKKPFNSLVSLLPSSIKNSVNASILGNVFDKNLTHEEAVKLFGLIGKYFPAKKDTRPWISQPTLEREMNMLTPMITSSYGTDDYMFSFADLVNKADISGVDIDTMSEWAQSQAFNYAPPIDLDKFTNFTSYYWIQAAVTDASISWNPDSQPEYYVIKRPSPDSHVKMPVSVATTRNISLNGTLIKATDWTVTFINANDFIVAPVEQIYDPVTGDQIPSINGSLSGNETSFIYANHISFSIVKGSIPFTVGDSFTINITQLSSTTPTVTFTGIGSGYMYKIIGLQPFGTIDGIQLKAGMRVLVKDQDNSLENGIYLVTADSWKRTFDSTHVLEVYAKAGSNIGTWSNQTGQFLKISISSNLSGWEMHNYWVHRDDLHLFGLSENGLVDRASRPIIEYYADIERVEGDKTRFNQIPLFNLYWLDGTLSPWISSIFFYAEDPTADLDVIMQKRLKADKNGNFWFGQGLISPNGKLLAYKQDTNVTSAWIAGPNENEIIVTNPILDGTGTGCLTDLEVRDISGANNPLINQTWVLIGKEVVPGSTDTDTFSLIGSKSTLPFPDAKVGETYIANEPTTGLNVPTYYISFKIAKRATNFKVGDVIVFITGIKATEYTRQEIWELTVLDQNSLSVIGNRAGKQGDAVFDQHYISDFLEFDIDRPMKSLSEPLELSQGQKFVFRTASSETPRYVYKGDDELPKTFAGGPIADVFDEGCWLTAPQLVYNPELENRSEMLHGDLVDHFSTMIFNQPCFFGSEYGSNNFRNITANFGLGGSIKALMGNSNLFYSLMSQQNLTPLTLIDFAQQQYDIAVNSLSDFLVSELPTALSKYADESIDVIFAAYSEYYGARSELLNTFKNSSAPIINWPLTLPLIGFIDATQPILSKFDNDLGIFVRVHHDGHESPIMLEDKIFEHNLALTEVLRSDQTLTRGTVGINPPNNPYKGQLWFNTSSKTLYFFKVQYDNIDTPENAQVNDLWFNRQSQTFKIWDGASWIDTTINQSSLWIPIVFHQINNDLIYHAETILFDYWSSLNAFNNHNRNVDINLDSYWLNYELSKFAVANGYDPMGTNYDPSDPFSWNYHNAIFENVPLGTARWHVIYRHYFSNFVDNGIILNRPDIQPWKFRPFSINAEHPTSAWLNQYQAPLQISSVDLTGMRYSVRCVAVENINLTSLPLKIDGIKTSTLDNGDFVLLIAQTNTSENGVYQYQTGQLVSAGISLFDGLIFIPYEGKRINTIWVVIDSLNNTIEQARVWKEQLWNDIQAAEPNMKLCVNPYTDELLPPYVAIYRWDNLNELPTTLNLSDPFYVATSSNQWTITHNFGRSPGIKVFSFLSQNLSNVKVIPENRYSVEYISNNELVITFNNNIELSGYVECYENNSLISYIPEGIDDRYQFGDEGPVEQVWRKSTAYNYALANVSYRYSPIKFLKQLWGFQTITLNGLNVDRITGKLISQESFLLHGDIRPTVFEIDSLISIEPQSSTAFEIPDISFTVFSQQYDEKLLLKSDITLVYLNSNGISDDVSQIDIFENNVDYYIAMTPYGMAIVNDSIDFNIYQPISVKISINDNGNYLIIGDVLSIKDQTSIYTPCKNVSYIGINQWYTQFLNYNSHDVTISENVNLLKKWHVKLGYRTSSVVEHDNFDLKHDLYGKLPETAYSIKLNKSKLFKNLWLHALRVQVIKIGQHKELIGQDVDGNSLYRPTLKGDDWEFRIENYFARHPQLEIYQFNESGLFETFNALSKAHSVDEWINYQEKTGLITQNLPINITGIQNLVTFINGYAQYLNDIGFGFGQGEDPAYDDETMRIENWQLEVEKLIDSIYKGAKEGNGYSVNPFLQKFWINTPEGLPATFVQNRFDDVLTSQFAYDLTGSIIDKSAITIIRFDDHSEIIGRVPLFGAHITLDAYEHVILFENYISEKHGLLFDPFLGLMVEKLQLIGKIQPNHHFRPSFGGFFVQDEKFRKNMVASIDDFSNYYNADKVFENDLTTKHALALLGFSRKKYFEFLDVAEKTEFNFWRALINAKGTNATFDAFLNSSKFEYAHVDEFWAYKIAEYGDAREKDFPELKLTVRDCLLKHSRFYFEDQYSSLVPESYTVISPTDETRWFSISDLNANVHFEAEQISEQITITVVDNIKLVELPISDKIIIDEWTGPVGGSYEKEDHWPENIIKLNGNGTHIIKFTKINSVNSRFNPLKLIDYVDKAVVDEISVWNPAFDMHTAIALEVINVVSVNDPAKYNYSTLKMNNQSYDTSRAWGEREVGRTWMDISNVDYIPYYDKNIFPNFEERLARWGSLAEYASLNVYEWVSSDIPPNEYDAKSLQDQLSADISNQEKKTGIAARKQNYQRTRSWLARPIAWSYVPVPSASQGGSDEVQMLTYATTKLFLTSTGAGATQVHLEKGSFSQYGISDGMHLSAWFNNKPYGELEFSGNARYSIGTFTENGGDIVVYRGVDQFNFVQVVWSDNKNYIGASIGQISITTQQRGNEYFITATDMNNKSVTIPLPDLSGITENSFTEYDFYELGIKLRCNLTLDGLAEIANHASIVYNTVLNDPLHTQAELDAALNDYVTANNNVLNGTIGASLLVDEFNNINFDIEIRSYMDAEILIPFPSSTLDNILPINIPILYSSEIVFAGINYFSEVKFIKGNTISIGTYSLVRAKDINSSYADNILALIKDSVIISTCTISDYHVSNVNQVNEIVYNLGQIEINAAISLNYIDLTYDMILDELTQMGALIIVGYDSSTGNISFETSTTNVLSEYGWRAWNVPSQKQLDADLSYPYNNWSPIFGEYVDIPSTKPLIDRISEYYDSPLIYNLSEIEKYKSNWGEWQEIKQEKLSRIGNDDKVSFIFSKKIDTSKFTMYVNGINQLKSFYSINENSPSVVTTTGIIPVGHKVTAIIAAYEPTSSELSFNPDVKDDPKIQVQYKTDYQYATRVKRDEDGTIVGNRYYFWVQGKSIPNNNKNISSQQSEALLINGPSTYVTFQELSEPVMDGSNIILDWRYKAISIAGLSGSVSKDNAFKLRFIRNFVLKDDPNQIDLKNVHQEWILMREKQMHKIPSDLWDKMVNAACGQNVIGQKLPSLTRVLYDERHTTRTRYGFGPDQVLAERSLVIASLKQAIKNPKTTIYRNGINNPVYIIGIDVNNLDDLFSTPEKTRQTLDFIWKTAHPQVINELFFTMMNDALSDNYEFSDIFKTSRLSAHSIITVKPEYRINDADVYY